MQSPPVSRIADLQQLIADFAKIKRTNRLADNPEHENDVEHSYGLALTCWFLQPYIAPDLDLQKILTYSLVHDLVELHAGDVYFLVDQQQAAEKKAKEAQALETIAKNWEADFPDLINHMRKYEEKVDEECWFVYAVDKILPPIMINLDEKDSYYDKWKLTKEELFDKKRETIAKSKHVAVYIDRYLEWLSDPDYYYKAEEHTKKQS